MVRAHERSEILCLAALTFAIGCGGEANGQPSSPNGGCSSQGTCPSTGGGGSSGSCPDGAPTSPPVALPDWPMPNPSAAGIANPSSYDTSQPGVAIDNVTGLMWQRELAPPDTQYTFDDAVAYCGRFEAAGHCDFRLPSRIELVSLVDFGRPDPAIDGDVFPSTKGDFISASQGFGENSRWSVRSDGATFNSSYTNVASPIRVRCVRQHVARQTPNPRYGFEGQAPNQTVTDHGTGLVWQRQPAEGKYTFAAAGAYCAGVGAGFRVPSMKELQTIVDETTNEPPLIDEAVFLGFPELQMGNAFFWTSSGSATYPGTNAWNVNFGNGGVTDYVISVGNVVDNEYYVRCVR